MATRRERVVLELEDNFTTGMARAAASAALLNRELDSLSKDSVRTRRSVSDIDQPIQNLGRSSGDASREVDKVSGRLRIFADVAAILGPGLVGIGAVGLPVVTGLAAQFGFAATAAGTSILAFQGVGTALKALNLAALTPTTENLNKAEVALEKLSPAAQGFVAQLGAMMPELKQLRDVAANGLFPGLTSGLGNLESALPHVRGLIASVADELGHIGAQAGASLSSDRWTSFLDFLARSAPHALGDMAKAAGNTAHALAELWMATDPINNDFGTWIVDATHKLDEWATGLSKTQGFADFVAYLDKTGPKVAETFGALANAVLQIVQAAAPLSGPVLDGVTALANLVSSIANSDLGTPLFTAVAALALFNRTLAITDGLQKSTFGGGAMGRVKTMGGGLKSLTADLRAYNAVQNSAAGRAKATAKQIDAQSAAAGRLSERAKTFGKTSALIAGVGIAASGAADGIGLTNTASLALAGTIAGPWGAAIGASVGLLLDAKDASKGFGDAMNEATLAAKTFDVTRISRSIDELKAKRKDLAHTTGPIDFLSDSLTEIRGAGAFSNHTLDNIDSKIQKLQGRLDMTKAAGSQALLRQGFQATSAGIDTATQSATKFQHSLETLNDVLSGRATQRDFQQSLDDFEARGLKRADLRKQIVGKQGDLATAQSDLATAKTPAQQAAAQNRIDTAKQSIKSLRDELKQYANTLDISTQAGRDNQAALDGIASSALKVAQGLSGANRVTFLAAARAEFVKAARAAGLAKDQAQALADKVLGLKGVKGTPRIVIDATGAWHVIDETARKLERLTRKTHVINIKAQAGKNLAAVFDIHSGQAGGGTIGGNRYPYADKVLVPLAPGEEVITNRNGEADKWRPFLKRINAGLANGGTVPFPTSAVQGGPFIDYERLAKAMAAVRPMYGDAHFYGDAAKREQDRLSGLDGRRRR